METLPRHLSKGLRVKLGDFGTFSVKLDTKSQETEELVTAHVVKGVKINFRPSWTLSQTMADTPLVKVS